MMRIDARFYRKTRLSGAACATLLLIAGFIISNGQQGGTITGRVNHLRALFFYLQSFRNGDCIIARML